MEIGSDVHSTVASKQGVLIAKAGGVHKIYGGDRQPNLITPRH